MTKRKSTSDVIEALEDDRLDVEHIENAPVQETKLQATARRITEKYPAPVVALTDQIEVARQALYVAAKSGAPAPVPDVLARALAGTDDVLLTVWRAWDIYATQTDDGWIIRADQVR